MNSIFISNSSSKLVEWDRLGQAWIGWDIICGQEVKAFDCRPKSQVWTRGRQRAILAYEISWFLFDFPVISLKNDIMRCKSGWGWRVGLISELDFKEICFDFSWFQLDFNLISTDFSTRCTRFLSLPTPRVWIPPVASGEVFALPLLPLGDQP